nr:MAG TPA: hypothetical protein [Caudoviricetes sp.]
MNIKTKKQILKELERVNKEIEKNKGSSFTLYPLIKYKEALLWVLEDKKEGDNYGFKKFNC